MRACAPASDHAFFPDFSKDPDMPMNMMLRSTPLEPPMLFARTLDKQLHVALGSANGKASFISSTFAAADAMVEPQSASPTLPSSSSSCCLALMSALQALSKSCATASSLEGATPSMGSRPLTPSTGSGNAGATALGQAAASVAAVRYASKSGVRRRSESDTPFMSREVHMAAGPTASFRLDAHLDFISAPANTHISCGGTPPKLLMRTA
mmetsp:Transcript_4382/g.12060  ORF Transcript_4382/g.12060 Transcript_4382/m.12060 type:complete len:210 (+) Transcript_4382:92-721(+)